jgi:formylmethanofuran dehydrogenase subunit C
MSNGRPTEDAREPLTLALQRVPRERVDVSPVTPSALAHASARDVPGIELRAGNRRLRVGDIFDVSGEDTAHVAIRNSCARLDRLGAGMRFGRISVHGDAGTHAGAAMAGGVLDLHGHAGAFVASGMVDGFLHVRGSAGDFLGAAIAGDATGMRGGTVVVDGSAGDRVGDRMRRGMVLIGGDVGDFCAARMIAGTIVVRGHAGRGTGVAMRRGTLLVARVPALPATFADGGPPPRTFLRLLQRHLRDAGGPLAPFAQMTDDVRRFVGDRAYGGLGEILVAQ